MRHDIFSQVRYKVEIKQMNYSDNQNHPFPSPPYSQKCNFDAEALFDVLNRHFPIVLYSSSFISVISPLKNNICKLVLEGGGCMLKAYVDAQGWGWGSLNYKI